MPARLPALLATCIACATTLAAQTFNLKEDDSVFPNPERGFYYYQSLDTLDDTLPRLRDDRGISLVWGKITLEAYRETPVLPAELIASYQRGFDRAQAAGTKVIVRVNYGINGPDGTYKTYQDPALEIIEGHIKQLAPLFAANADRIAFFEGGYVGPWGEWHGTKIANTPELQRRVITHILDNTPRERMVVLRYPALKQSVFQSIEPLTDAQAYDGSHLARTGHHNDCFLSGDNDVGTYNRGGMTMAEDIAYLHAETRHTLFGGESCGLHARGERASALHEMEHLHASYLNAAYHPDLLKRWRENGVMDVVERRLGARFVATTFDLPAKGHPGKKLRVRLSIANKGYAALYNARPAELVLIAANGKRHRFPLATETRRWKAGETVELVADITLPRNLAVGKASWALHLPDASARLAADPRFSYRLANVDAWDAETGENRLVTEWPVTR